MKEALAERLLAKVMGWTAEDVARERPDLQAMAAYKYDGYQQFSAGMRFVESLARWLDQFQSGQEKEIAYRFVKDELIYCSAEEMNHLVSIAYPDRIRPVLLRRTARAAGLNERHLGRIANSPQFKIYRRRCLFLGLSDGARIDIFRRANNQELRHDQIFPTYQISADRATELIEKLKQALSDILGVRPPQEMVKFRTVVLLDDFCASGLSYLRKEEDNLFRGKIGNFFQSITDPNNPASQLVDISQTEVLVVLYMATERARQRLESLCKELEKNQGMKWSVIVVHPFYEEIRILPARGHAMEKLIEANYDSADETESTRKGGTDLRYGFSWCGLPVVLHHNTPNNSLYLLWAESSQRVRPLFPRVSRHRAEI